jgi:hypothetical protein
VQLRTQKSEEAPGGAPDSEQWLSGAPPDCPVAQMSEAPTVGTQRLGDVVGALDCPVRPSTRPANGKKSNLLPPIPKSNYFDIHPTPNQKY